MLKGFLDDPNNFHGHIRRYTFSLSTQLIFGHRCPDMDDPDLEELFIGGIALLQTGHFADHPRTLRISGI